jgi:hypothetical protein
MDLMNFTQNWGKNYKKTLSFASWRQQGSIKRSFELEQKQKRAGGSNTGN